MDGPTTRPAFAKATQVMSIYQVVIVLMLLSIGGTMCIKGYNILDVFRICSGQGVLDKPLSL